jgi:hypothetical protein
MIDVHKPIHTTLSSLEVTTCLYRDKMFHKKIPKFIKHASYNCEVFSAFQERYSRWSVEENTQVFVTKGKRGKQKWVW